jgi:hypothetical protein
MPGLDCNETTLTDAGPQPDYVAVVLLVSTHETL